MVNIGLIRIDRFQSNFSALCEKVGGLGHMLSNGCTKRTFSLNIGLIRIDQLKSIVRLSERRSVVWANGRKMVAKSIRFG